MCPLFSRQSSHMIFACSLQIAVAPFLFHSPCFCFLLIMNHMIRTSKMIFFTGALSRG
uniref:Uncharacterized protein n=1 Tax=Arundo donax TaxID=35708 RepID=A0A0A9GFL9_ARUDO